MRWSYHEALSVFSSIPRCSIPLNLSVKGKGTLAVYIHKMVGGGMREKVHDMEKQKRKENGGGKYG